MKSSDHKKLNKKNWTKLRREHYALLKSFLDKVPDNSEVLDIGAGPSPSRDLYARFKLTSVDWEKQEIVDLVVDLDKTLPFKDESFDVVTSNSTFEHLYTDKSFFESNRVLRKEGWIIGSVPFLIAIHQAPYDYYRFTRFLIERKLAEAGYRNIKVVELGSAYDVVYHTTRQMFMKLFDKNWFVAKISWNLLKLYFLVFGRFLSSVENKNICLGYMFYGQK